MVKTIYVDPLDPASIDKAIKDLNNYKRWLRRKSKQLCKRLADIGADVGRINFAGGFIDGNDDGEISVTPVSDGYLISADGTSVCFLEFGTGVAAGNGYDTTVIDPPVPITPKSWSSTNGTGEFAKYGSWHHDGRKYEMTTPRMGMYHAVKEIERQLPLIAREVFGS